MNDAQRHICRNARPDPIPRRVLYVSGYELGRQPLGTGVAAAVGTRFDVRQAAVDCALGEPDWKEAIASLGGAPDLAFFHASMHAGLRLAIEAAKFVAQEHPRAARIFAGDYAWLLRQALFDDDLADAVLAGAWESAWERILREGLRERDEIPGVATPGHDPDPLPRGRTDRPAPARDLLPDFERYARFEDGPRIVLAAAVETTVGCKHRCRHCPIPSVWDGRFAAVDADTVLADVESAVLRGAEHLTFADPDFLNGPRHATRIVEAVHERWPELTFDFTAKVEHLVTHAALLRKFVACGARFVVSAVESLSPLVLDILDKGHTPRDVETALTACRDAGLALRPTFVAFTPWTKHADYGDLLEWVTREGLIEYVDAVQWTLRLLVPEGSLLAEHPDWLPHAGAYEPQRFGHAWAHPDPAMDQLQHTVSALVRRDAAAGRDARETFNRIVCAWENDSTRRIERAPVRTRPPSSYRPPRLTEPWFC